MREFTFKTWLKKLDDGKYSASTLDKKDLDLIIGCKVTEITEFSNDSFDSGFVIHFDNGMKLGR